MTLLQGAHLMANTQKPAEINSVIASQSPYGQAKLSKLFFGDVYNISLWTDARTWSFHKPYALSIEYLMPIESDQLVDTTINEFERLGAPNLENYRNQLKLLFPSVKEGDRITSFFNPNADVVFFFNGSQIGTIKDGVFRKYFSDIWLSPETQEPEMRNSLLRMQQAE
jgi:hypothetical protein